VGTIIDTTKTRPKSRVLFLITLLNLILLGWLLYTTFGQSLTPSGGASIVLINDTQSPMVGVSLSYPGGTIDLARIEPKQRIGSPVHNPGECDATLTFKDEAGHAYKETFRITPVGELLINIYILPVWEETIIKTADGTEEKVFKPSPSRVRILPSYQGENLRI
jgi:hypothetical protein